MKIKLLLAGKSNVIDEESFSNRLIQLFNEKDDYLKKEKFRKNIYQNSLIL